MYKKCTTLYDGSLGLNFMERNPKKLNLFTSNRRRGAVISRIPLYNLLCSQKLVAISLPLGTSREAVTCDVPF